MKNAIVKNVHVLAQNVDVKTVIANSLKKKGLLSVFPKDLSFLIVKNREYTV